MASNKLRAAAFWVWSVTAIVALLGILFLVRGWAAPGGATLLLALILGSQAWRLGHWAAKIDRAEREAAKDD